ncbi:MAG: DUF721 domain-containing protein [Candidatus Babeliales bacterium]|nr:DUF721 domain-containing protein [Candidatus Babeliales bacterium]
MSTQIKDLLHTIFKDIKNNDAWQVYLLTNWNSIIGNLQSKVKLEKIYEDTLVLAVYDSSWMQELFLMSNMLIIKINSKLDAPRIKHLRFKIAERAKVKKVIVKNIEPEKKIYLNSQELTALSKITDPELNEGLKNFLIRCHRER